ncbi:MAG: DUF885 domain-containing protein [Planctomycetes bacterium]|nr:DUF885 domain-containing protein [Planctomycetota bacterium]
MTPALILTMHLICAAPDQAADPAVDQAFETLTTKYIKEFPELSPTGATILGDHRFDNRLDEVTDAARQKSAALARRYLAELAKIAPAKLTRAHQVDYQMLDQSLRAELWRYEKLRDWAWNPLIYTELTGNSIYGLLAREFAPLTTRLGHVADRLEQFPQLLQQVRATLDVKRVPPIHAETAVKQNRGVLSILENMVEPHLGTLPDAERTRMQKAIATAREAIEAHQKWLETELLPHAAGDFRIGRQLFDEKLAFTLFTPMTREQIRDRALSELERGRAEMYQTAQEVYKKKHPYTTFPAKPAKEYQQAIIRAALEIAANDQPPADAIVEKAKETLVVATNFIRSKDLMTLPDDPLDIIIMPEFQRGVSIAYCESPGPLDVGQKTYYAISPLPTDWSATQVNSFLREYNIRSLHDLTIHEAMPGHFVQLAMSNRYPSTLRAVLSSGVFVEGWAVYAERVMVEAGYLDNDPLMKLVNLKWYLRSISNALMDQAIHVDGMNREEAMRLMIEDTFQEEREAALKWVRAQLTSTQLSTYFVGMQEHLDLRREAQAAWGKDFQLKKYHDQVVSFGSPPVQFVRALMLDKPIPGTTK